MKFINETNCHSEVIDLLALLDLNNSDINNSDENNKENTIEE